MSAQKGPARAVVFAYSSVGYRCLQVLLEQGVEVPLVYTHADDPGEERWFESVHELAAAHGLTTLTPDSLDGEAEIERIRDARPDVIFSFYYRSLIPMSILNLAPLGAFNMHGSLLPRYRGRACVNWAVLNGETETGVTLHHMTERADRGNVVDQMSVSIGPDDTAHDVFLKLIPAAGEVLARSLGAILAGEAQGTPQDESKATLFGRRRPEDGLLDWRMSSASLHNLVRAVAWPFPGAFAFLQGRKLMVWRSRPLTTEDVLMEIADEDERAGRMFELMTTPCGTVISSRPLRIRTDPGALEILEAQWADERGERKADGLQASSLSGEDACPFVEAGTVFDAPRVGKGERKERSK